MTLHRIEIFGPSGLGKSTALAGALRILAADGTAPGLLGPRAHAGHHEATFSPLPHDRRHAEVMALGQSALCDLAFDIAARLRTTPENRLLLLELFLGTLRRTVSAASLPGRILVHDELLLRRAFTFLPLSDTPADDARAWFSMVTLPDAGVLCFGTPDQIAARYAGRLKVSGKTGLSYDIGKDTDALPRIDRIVECCDIAEEVLTSRGLRLHQLDLSGSPEQTATALAHVLRDEADRLA